MPNLFRRLLDVRRVYAGRPARQIQYLKTERTRCSVRRSTAPSGSHEERSRLVRLAKAGRVGYQALVSIIGPQAFLRWIRDADKRRPKKNTGRKSGRPKSPEQIGGWF